MLRTVLLLTSALAFGLGTMVVKGKQSGMEFFAGYLVEQSLSVDNLFVFIMLFEYFKVPPKFQGRVLTWGIIGAVSMRAVMIVVGVAAIKRFRWVILFFAGILCVSSVKLLREGEHGDDEDLGDNFVLKVSKWMVKSVDFYDGEKFFTMVDGVKRATPLLLCLVCIELSDFVFAVDSIPAVLGISQDSFIVYTSNVFAILALRSLYTLVSTAITDLPYLKPAVALVLGFVGVKMVFEFFGMHVGIGISLSVVGGVLAAGTIASIWANGRRAAAATVAASPAVAVAGGTGPDSEAAPLFTAVTGTRNEVALGDVAAGLEAAAAEAAAAAKAAAEAPMEAAAAAGEAAVAEALEQTDNAESPAAP